MIDPPSLSHLPRISPETLKFRFGLHMVKDDWPPQNRISPEILKFRFGLHMVRDDWHPFIYLPRILPEILKFRFSLHMDKNDWSPLSLPPTQNFPRNFKV